MSQVTCGSYLQETRTRGHRYGFPWVWVRVELELPVGYPCYALVTAQGPWSIKPSNIKDMYNCKSSIYPIYKQSSSCTLIHCSSLFTNPLIFVIQNALTGLSKSSMVFLFPPHIQIQHSFSFPLHVQIQCSFSFPFSCTNQSPWFPPHVQIWQFFISSSYTNLVWFCLSFLIYKSGAVYLFSSTESCTNPVWFVFPLLCINPVQYFFPSWCTNSAPLTLIHPLPWPLISLYS